MKNVPKNSDLEIAIPKITVMGTRSKDTDKWRSKAIARRKCLHRTSQELKRQRARAEKWRSAYYELKKSTSLTAVKNYTYPLELIWMAILMHVNFNVSLRSAAKSVAKLGQLFGCHIKTLSHMSVRNWYLKLCLYRLRQPLVKGNYVLISDESIEIGRERLLLLYVVPIQDYSLITPLKMEDVKVLDLGVQLSWSSQQVSHKINQKIKAHGIEITYGISDNCSKLKKAMQQCNILRISDCTHEIATVSKALFQKDTSFIRFINQMNSLRRKWILSKHVLLVPPELRSKNRFNRIFLVHKWAEQILRDWPNLRKEAKKELAFVKEEQALIKSMRQCCELIDIFSLIFKCKGIQSNSLKQWHERIRQYRADHSLDDKAEHFIEKMNNYLNNQRQIMPHQDQILCCSDVIESTFGKYKNKKVKIITDDILKILGYSTHCILEEVGLAMQNTSMADVQKWKQENTTVSKLALLKQKAKIAA